MGMFSKVIAFLDKAAGVPLWIVHAENIRKLEERGCPTLVKAIIEVPEMGHVASWEPAQVWGIMVQPDNWIEKVLSKDLFDQIKSELESAHEDLASKIDTVNDSLENEKKVAEKIDQLLSPTADMQEEEESPKEPSELSQELVQGEQPEQTLSPTTAPDLDNLDTDAIPLDEAAKAQLLQGMMAVISRGRKPAPTLKVLNNMSMGDKGLIIEALSAMEARGNSLAKAILEDPSL